MNENSKKVHHSLNALKQRKMFQYFQLQAAKNKTEHREHGAKMGSNLPLMSEENTQPESKWEVYYDYKVTVHIAKTPNWFPNLFILHETGPIYHFAIQWPYRGNIDKIEIKDALQYDLHSCFQSMGNQVPKISLSLVFV